MSNVVEYQLKYAREKIAKSRDEWMRSGHLGAWYYEMNMAMQALVSAVEHIDGMLAKRSCGEAALTARSSFEWLDKKRRETNNFTAVPHRHPQFLAMITAILEDLVVCAEAQSGLSEVEIEEADDAHEDD